MTEKTAVCAEFRQGCHIFTVFLRRFVWNYYRLALADNSRFLHIAAARYCGLRREAAALSGRFLPELGRSSERPFFSPKLSRRAPRARKSGVAPSSIATYNTLNARADAATSLKSSSQRP